MRQFDLAELQSGLDEVRGLIEDAITEMESPVVLSGEAKVRQFRIAIAANGWTRRDFANHIGVHPSLISNVLNGRKKSARVTNEINLMIQKTPTIIMEEQYEAA